MFLFHSWEEAGFRFETWEERRPEHDGPYWVVKAHKGDAVVARCFVRLDYQPRCGGYDACDLARLEDETAKLVAELTAPEIEA